VKFGLLTRVTANELRCLEQQTVSEPRYDCVTTPSGDHTLSTQTTPVNEAIVYRILHPSTPRINEDSIVMAYDVV